MLCTDLCTALVSFFLADLKGRARERLAGGEGRKTVY